MTKYPNLLELIRYYPCGTPAVCDHAGIEPELLGAVLDGAEELTPVEIMGLSRLYGCPAGVLYHPGVIMLDMGRMKHHRMVKDVVSIHGQLLDMAAEGNRKAAQYINSNEWRYLEFTFSLLGNKLSYCHYLGVKKTFLNFVQWLAPAPKGRGLERM